MKTHRLKINSDYFQAILNGEKTFELRRNDRNYKVGDILILQETAYSALDMIHGSPLQYTGREQRLYVTDILYGRDWLALPDDWCVISFRHADNRCRHVGGCESLAADRKIKALQADIRRLEARLRESGAGANV